MLLVKKYCEHDKSRLSGLDQVGTWIAETHMNMRGEWKGACVDHRRTGSETWTVYRHHVMLLGRFHQNCIHRILNFKWSSYMSYTAILEHVERAYKRSTVSRKVNSESDAMGGSCRYAPPPPKKMVVLPLKEKHRDVWSVGRELFFLDIFFSV